MSYEYFLLSIAYSTRKFHWKNKSSLNKKDIFSTFRWISCSLSYLFYHISIIHKLTIRKNSKNKLKSIEINVLYRFIDVCNSKYSIYESKNAKYSADLIHLSFLKPFYNLIEIQSFGILIVELLLLILVFGKLSTLIDDDW